MMASVVAGLGSWLPKTVVTNDDLADRLDTSDEWIRRRTGIVSRRVVLPGTSTMDMAVAAGANALKSADCSSVDAVLLATSTPDRPSPAGAPELAARLGLSGAAACDIGSVCAGFVYLLALGNGLIAAGTADRVLLVASEAYSRIVDPADRQTAVIFGDGAGAVILRRGGREEDGAIDSINLGSDGDNADLIHIPGGTGLPAYLTMQGSETYRQAVARMTASSRQALRHSGWTPEDVDALIPHQANRRIMDAVADRVGIPMSRRVSNIETIGNTAAASIPLAMVHGVEAGMLRPGVRVLLTAFGGGLSWGSATLSWPELRPVSGEGANS